MLCTANDILKRVIMSVCTNTNTGCLAEVDLKSSLVINKELDLHFLTEKKTTTKKSYNDNDSCVTHVSKPQWS